jgi:hypothetical protein
MSRKPINYKDILSMFHPKGMLEYFDFTDYSGLRSQNKLVAFKELIQSCFPNFYMLNQSW